MTPPAQSGPMPRLHYATAVGTRNPASKHITGRNMPIKNRLTQLASPFCVGALTLHVTDPTDPTDPT